MRMERLETNTAREVICQQVIANFSAWFGAQAVDPNHVCNIVNYPLFVAYQEDDQLVGFLSLRERSVLAAEIYLLCVLQACHFQGIGATLIAEAERYAKQQQKKFIQVNTISEVLPILEIEMARKFYGKFGYQMNEVEGSRLVLVKTIQ